MQRDCRWNESKKILMQSVLKRALKCKSYNSNCTNESLKSVKLCNQRFCKRVVNHNSIEPLQDKNNNQDGNNFTNCRNFYDS